MIFPLFALLTTEREDGFSIYHPIYLTNVSEIRNWTLKGSAVNMKDFIRLTNTAPKDYGIICQRSPTYFRDWVFDIELRADGGNGGRGFWIFFTEELCPFLPSEWNGICFWINSSSIDSNGLSPIFFGQNYGLNYSPSNFTKVGDVRVRSNLTSLILRISRINDTITVSNYINQQYDIIFSSNITNLTDMGYFTITSITTEQYDFNDIISINVTSLSEHFPINPKLCERNRKMIEHFVESRRIGKIKRRLLMPTMLQYLDQSFYSDYLLTGNCSFSDSFLLIMEANNRAKSIITVDELKLYIDYLINEKIYKAYQTVDIATKYFAEIQSDIRNIWSELKNQLDNLSSQSRIDMISLEEELFIEAKSINLDHFKYFDSIPQFKDQALKLVESYVSKTLIVIAFTELITYILFFVIKRYQTNGFKKHD